VENRNSWNRSEANCGLVYAPVAAVGDGSSGKRKGGNGFRFAKAVADGSGTWAESSERELGGRRMGKKKE